MWVHRGRVRRASAENLPVIPRCTPIPTITVEIIYALPQRAIHKELTFDSAATVERALSLAAADPLFADIDLALCTCGIFGRVARADELLRDGDRIEIYRPLAADPKNARRERVKEARKKRR